MANREASELELVKSTVGLLDEYGHLYHSLSAGRTSNYLDYVRLGKADESQFIQPTLFPEFLSHVLGYSRHLDYIPEKPGAGGKTPDFTPIDTFLHPWLFETKGCDSSTADLVAEYHSKSGKYLETHPNAKFVVITNMVELVVYSKDSDKVLDDLSFSFLGLYGAYKANGFNPKDQNVQRFVRFAKEFRRRELSTEGKIQAIARAKPHLALDFKAGGYRELETLANSIRSVVEWMRTDIKNSQGVTELLALTNGDEERRRLIAMEIYAIRHEVNPSLVVPEDITGANLATLVESPERAIKNAMDLYFYRVAYFTMARILLVRAWEDSRFIDEKFQTLYDGGFSRWYFDNLDKQIGRVLKQAFAFAREKYEWLFTDRTNYSWYIPTDSTLADVLYELAKYNLSVLNSDVLGTVYEEYLDTQDKKNKGQYYTPAPIVELIWNRLGYGNEKTIYTIEDGKKVPRTIFDPATGSGSFLVEAARRIRSHLYASSPLARVEAMKTAIVNNLYGSEISPFSYYLTEVNLLIQLTPVIKKLVELDPQRRQKEGRFTLSVIRQDSLSLHTPPRRITEGPASAPEPDQYYGFEILKPTGDKLRIFEHIRTHQDFDYVVGNPPYIGEDDHKELFRRTLALFPWWRTHYLGKMDYLYFFVILGLQKLKPGGRLGFITTSYWLTADGAAKLRRYVRDNARIVEIINFHELKLFEHAKGQHNIVFVLEKAPKPEAREANKIRLAEVKATLPGATVLDRLRATCQHVADKMGTPSHRDEYVAVYDAPVLQGKLTDSAWFLFHSADDESLLKTIEAKGVPLASICTVSQGVAPNPQRVDKATLAILPQNVIAENAIKVGDGVFVLTEAEIATLGIPAAERSLLRSFYKNSNVHRYSTDEVDREALIYTSKNTNMQQFPTILEHLRKFKARLDQRRETQDGKIPWFSLHWSREERLFEGPKIVCPYRSPVNTFAYHEGSFYGSTDMYFVKSRVKGNDGKVIHPLTGAPIDLRYVVGLLNSKVLRLWTLRKTKAKGRMRELFPTQLEQFPICLPETTTEEGIRLHDAVVQVVQEIQAIKRKLASFDAACGEPPTSLDETGPAPALDRIRFLQTCPRSMVTELRGSVDLALDNIPSDFILKGADAVAAPVSHPNQHVLPIHGKGGQTQLIKGPRDNLELVRVLLGGMKGASKSQVESMRVPADMTQFEAAFESAKADLASVWKRLQTAQAELDRTACQLYGVNQEEIDAALGNAEPSDDGEVADVE